MLAEIPRGGTALDVGANYGFLTRIAARATGVEGRVVAFEMDVDIAHILSRSLESNGLTQVDVVQGAVGSDPSSVRLDDYCDQLTGVEFIKIDVDGPELEVLKGGHRLIQRDRPVIVVEMNRAEQQIYDLLSDLGYTQFMGMSNEEVQPGRWPPNLIASTREVRIPGV